MGLAALALALALDGTPQSAAPRANVVVVMVDDLGWLDHGLDLPGAPPVRVRTLAGDLEPWIERVGAQLSLDASTGSEIEPPLAALLRDP